MRLCTYALSIASFGLSVVGCSSSALETQNPRPDASESHDGGGKSEPDASASKPGDSTTGTDSGAADVHARDAGETPKWRPFPLVTPPVRAAAPPGLGGTSSKHHRHFPGPPGPDGGPLPGGGGAGLTAADFDQRFFANGPTDLYFVLGTIDALVQGINTMSGNGTHGCLTDPPVSYNITPLGQVVPFYAQCYELSGQAPGLIQFGQYNGATYYYAADGEEWVAAILTPADAGAADGGTDAGQADASADAAVDASNEGGAPPPAYVVQAWTGIGYTNGEDGGGCGAAWDDCSYGMIELLADSSQGTFEMGVAGIGFGYCGAQLKSDGLDIFGIGSTDMGTTCNPASTLCVSAATLAEVGDAGACAPPLTTFGLPAVGRVASTGPRTQATMGDGGQVFGASQYPGLPGDGESWVDGGAMDTVLLTGTGSDSLRFGPVTPTPGLNAF